MKFKSLMATVTVCLCLAACSSGSDGSPPPSIVGINLGEVIQTREVNAQFSATSGVTPYTFSISGNVPGLMLSTDGQLSGIATTAGDYQLSVTVTDARGRTDTIDMLVQVVAPPEAFIRYTGTFTEDSGAENDIAATPYIYQTLELTFDTPTAQNTSAVIETFSRDENNELFTSWFKRYDYTYDANGYYSGFDRFNQPDGVLDYTITYQNNSDGQRLVTAVDSQGDGIFERTTTVERDSAGRAIRTVDEIDGVFANEELITRNTAGYITARVRDQELDGIAEFFEERTYNPADPTRAIQLRQDWNADEVWDRVIEVSWTDHTDGSITRVEQVFDRGSLNAIYTFEIPAANVADYRPLFSNVACNLCTYSERVRHDVDEPYVDLSHTREWDEAGRVVRFVHDQAVNNYTRTTLTEYDAEGKPTRRTWTTVYDGLAGERINVLEAEYIDWTLGNVSGPQFGIGAG